MTPAELIAGIGGILVASFTLDAEGRTVGARSTHNRRSRCSACGEPGHVRSRCNGPGMAPKPLHRDTRMSQRSVESTRRRIRKADSDLEAARVEIARRIAAKAKS